MSLTSETTRVSYSGNGSTTAFPITFEFWDADDLLVINTVTATGVETAWTRGNQFTVSGGSGSTGTLTATTAPAAGTTLSIISDLPNTQPTSLPVGGQFPSASVEQQLDQIVRQGQQLAKRIDRALVQPDGDAADIDTLPAKVDRASMFLAFDANGDPIASVGATAISTPVSVFMATVLDDADAATARTTLGAAATASDNSFSADQTIVSTDATAAVGPFLKLHRNSASPAASDLIGAVDFQGKNSTPATKSYARLLAQILDATAATEDAQLEFWTIVAGTLARAGYIGQGLVVGSPSGGDKGAGTVNASHLYLGGALSDPIFTKSFASSAQTITAAGQLTIAHGLGVEPITVFAELQCTSNSEGYTAGQHVPINLNMCATSTASQGVSIIKDATNLTVRYGSDANVFEIIRADTGNAATLTIANWKLVLKAFA